MATLEDDSDSSVDGTPAQRPPPLPSVWEYTDYRSWLTDTYHARKAIHRWFSYGVLAQRAGFKARDFLLRVMRGERCLSAESATRLAEALDLSRKEQEYFRSLVAYNQAKNDQEREVAWGRVQHALAKSRNASAPRLLTDIHREVLGQWHHLAIRSWLEMHPDTGDWEALGRKLVPHRTAAVVRRSIELLERGGLVEKRSDGLWHATEKSVTTPAEVGLPALRSFHRDCLQLASEALETLPAHRRNVTGVTLGISERTYRLVCDRLTELRTEIGLLAEADGEADRVYQLTLSLFPFSGTDEREERP